MIAFVIILVLIVVLIAKFEFQKWQTNKKLTTFSRLKEWPVIGFGLCFIGADNEEVMRLADQTFYDVPKTPYSCWLGPQLVIGVDDPHNLQIILNADECLDKAYVYAFLHNETGIFSSKADVWKVHRRALNPTFNHKILLGFFPTFNEKAKVLLDQLENNYADRPSDIYRPFYKMFTDGLLNTVMDTNWDMQSEDGDKLYDCYMKIMSYIQRRMVRFWLKWDFVYNLTPAYRAEMKQFRVGYYYLRKIKNDKAVELAEALKNGEDVLEKSREANTLNWIQKCFLLLREGKFNDQNVIEEIDTIFVGGTDTSTVTATSVITMLAIHPDIQQKVVDELDDIFGADDRPITYEDVTKMTYMEMVIKETLRHYPVGPFLGRQCSKDLQIVDGIIPKGAFILINVLKLHKNAAIWGPNSDRFYPEHFLPENLSKMHPYSYLAFSAGPRNCIGIKYGLIVVKIALAYVLRKYKLSSDLTLADVRTKVHVILKIANENPVRFEKRRK